MELNSDKQILKVYSTSIGKAEDKANALLDKNPKAHIEVYINRKLLYTLRNTKESEHK